MSTNRLHDRLHNDIRERFLNNPYALWSETYFIEYNGFIVIFIRIADEWRTISPRILKHNGGIYITNG